MFLPIKNTKSNENYLSLPSDLFKNIDESGFTVGMWVKVNSETTDATALFEAKSSKNRNCYPYTALHSSVYCRLCKLGRNSKRKLPDIIYLRQMESCCLYSL